VPLQRIRCGKKVIREKNAEKEKEIEQDLLGPEREKRF